MYAKKVFRFEKLFCGDLVKFIHDGEIHYGKVVDEEVSSETNHLQIVASKQSTTLPQGLPLTVDRRSVLQSYPSELAKKITPRLSLKHLWKNLVFREVKTVIPGPTKYVEYRYISATGFENIERFPTLEQAKKNVSKEYHCNIISHYSDYYGFTTDQSLVKNDPYYDKEIFFSKKCYSELDWSQNPTGDFNVNERENHTFAPLPDSLICGLIELGEKGLFFRKWFVCSKQFFTLWTMVCDSKNETLKDFKKNIPKSFDKLMTELNTSDYNVGYNIKLSIQEKRHKHYVWNLEKAALFFSDRYQKIARVLFKRAHLDDRSGYSYSEENEWDEFENNLRTNLMWPKQTSF